MAKAFVGLAPAKMMKKTEVEMNKDTNEAYLVVKRAVRETRRQAKLMERKAKKMWRSVDVVKLSVLETRKRAKLMEKTSEAYVAEGTSLQQVAAEERQKHQESPQVARQSGV